MDCIFWLGQAQHRGQLAQGVISPGCSVTTFPKAGPLSSELSLLGLEL